MTSVLRSNRKLGSVSAAVASISRKIPLRHQRDVFVCAGETTEVEVDRHALHLHSDRVDEPMRKFGELLLQAELVEQPQRARVHRVAAEIAQEIGVLLHHRDIDAGAGQ